MALLSQLTVLMKYEFTQHLPFGAGVPIGARSLPKPAASCLEPGEQTGERGSVEIHLVCLLGKLGQEMLLVAVSVKPFGFTLAGGLA